MRSLKHTTLLRSALAAAGVAALAAAAPATAAGAEGFIYGKVITRSGSTYEGRLRWNGDEEAFWGDLFNGTKEERPYLDQAPARARRRRETIEIFGVTIGLRWVDHESGRLLGLRFGDLRRLELARGDEATLVTKGGTEFPVEGGSNDLGADITVWDASLGEVELDWDKIRSIEFLPTPAGLAVPVQRLQGVVKTRAGEFRGFVQWDQEECLTTDELDGETEDGDLAIQMGKIRSIERRSSRSSRVVLRDGRELVLDGTNDVNDENRGIYVEDARFGRVLVSWDAFERVDFAADLSDSGPAYGDFAPGKPLRGTVTRRDGTRLAGRLVYDLDEEETTELLNGSWDDIEYHIPFALIAAIVPQDWDSSRIQLRAGGEVVLEDQTDVGEGNAGLLVFASDGARPTYVEWEDVKRIDFE
jgi:hypothetical protein